MVPAAMKPMFLRKFLRLDGDSAINLVEEGTTFDGVDVNARLSPTAANSSATLRILVGFILVGEVVFV